MFQLHLLTYLAAVALVTLRCDVTDALTSAPSPVVFCYYSTHSQNRPGIGKFLPENIDTTLCTHVIFAFADVIDGQYLRAHGHDDVGENGKCVFVFVSVLRLRCSVINTCVLSDTRVNTHEQVV